MTANAFLFANNSLTTLASGIGPTDTAVALAPGSGALFPSPMSHQQFAMTFTDAATETNNEIVYVTARSGDNLTVVRGQEGTTATSWLAGDLASNLLTAGQMEALQQIVSTPFQPFGVADTGSVNTIVGTNAAIQAYAANMFVAVTMAYTNTGAVTANFNSFGSRAVLDQSGNALTAGMLVGGSRVLMVDNGTALLLLATLPATQFIASLAARPGGLQTTDVLVVGLPDGTALYKAPLSGISAAVSAAQFQQAFFLGKMNA